MVFYISLLSSYSLYKEVIQCFKLLTKTYGQSKLPQAQFDILHYLYRFRFLTSPQLQNYSNTQTFAWLTIISKTNHTKPHRQTLLTLTRPCQSTSSQYLSSGSIKLSDKIDFDKRALKRIYRKDSFSTVYCSCFILFNYFLYSRWVWKFRPCLPFFTKTDLLAHP